VPAIFVSHSSRDTNGIEFVRSLCTATGVRAHFYSWDGTAPPHGTTIKERIGQSDSLLVLLSPQLEDSHASIAWVGFEVGVAIGLGRPVWVLERQIGSGHPGIVRVPVPGLTGYLERPGSLDTAQTEPYYSLVAQGGKGTPVHPKGGTIRRMTCPRDDCQSEYYEYHVGPLVVCPICRKEIRTE
jgi:hypothetical protein